MGRRKSTEEFVQEARLVYGNRFDYSKVIYEKRDKKIAIICSIHGEFQQRPVDHLKSVHGCAKCAGNSNSTTGEFIIKSQKIHGDKYDYSKALYKSSHTKIIIICPEHGEFSQTPANHLHGYGCTECRYTQKTTEEFIQEAKLIHGDRYDYSNVNYIGNHVKVAIICPEHGEFLQEPSSHLRGCGCKSCIGRYIKTTEEFIKYAREVHNSRYNYSKVQYVDYHHYITIICPEHGEFLQRVCNHLRGHGCQRCGGNIRKSTEEFIQKATEIHDNNYDYSKTVYISNSVKVTIICPEHGEFSQFPSVHLRGSGCSHCRNKTEGKLLLFLKQKYPGIEIDTEFKISSTGYRRYDFCIPSMNLIIELDGPHHFGNFYIDSAPVSITQKIDIFKMIRANQTRFSIIRVLQKDVWKNMNNWREWLKDNIRKYDIPTNIFPDNLLYDNHRYLLKRGIILQDLFSNKDTKSTRSIKYLISKLCSQQNENSIIINRSNEIDKLNDMIISGYKFTSFSEYDGIRKFFTDILCTDLVMDITEEEIAININREDSLFYMLQ